LKFFAAVHADDVAGAELVDRVAPFCERGRRHGIFVQPLQLRKARGALVRARGERSG